MTRSTAARPFHSSKIKSNYSHVPYCLHLGNLHSTFGLGCYRLMDDTDKIEVNRKKLCEQITHIITLRQFFVLITFISIPPQLIHIALLLLRLIIYTYIFQFHRMNRLLPPIN